MSKKILIVEDDDFLRSLAVAKLEKESFTVLMAANGKEGVDLIQKELPDLIILDLMLPETSGFEVLKIIKDDEATKNIKVVVFSNLGDESDIKTCTDLGVNDYMVKSQFTLDELVDKIKGLLK